MSVAPVVTPKIVPKIGRLPTELRRIAQRNIDPRGHKQPPKNAQENLLAGAAAAICGLAQSHSPAPPPAVKNKISVISRLGNNLQINIKEYR